MLEVKEVPGGFSQINSWRNNLVGLTDVLYVDFGHIHLYILLSSLPFLQFFGLPSLLDNWQLLGHPCTPIALWSFNVVLMCKYAGCSPGA